MKTFLIQIIDFIGVENLSTYQKIRFLARYVVLLIFPNINNGIRESYCLDNHPFFYSGIHKNVVMDHLMTHISTFKNYYNSESIIIDIGASFGTFPRIANSFYPGVKAYCIEMADVSFQILQKNISFLPNIKAYKTAIGNKSGQVSYHFDTAFPEGAFISKTTSKNTVNMMTLDSFVRKNNIKEITLVKIDTEGHELQVLAGAKSVLNLAGCFIIETGLDSKNFGEVFTIMKNNNFRLVNFGEINYDSSKNRIDSCDLVFKKINYP